MLKPKVVNAEGLLALIGEPEFVKGRLILFQGASGSGKTTLINRLVERLAAKGCPCTPCEADEFWSVDGGEYRFRANFLDEAHGYCTYKAARELYNRGFAIVGNVFSSHEYFKPYTKLADKFDVTITTVRLETRFTNVHGVADKVVDNQVGKIKVCNFPMDYIVR